MDAKELVLEKDSVLAQPDRYGVAGLVRMGKYSELPTKNGGSYIGGNLQAKGDIPFKVWSNANAFSDLLEDDYSGQIMNIEAEVNEYNGSKSLVIHSAKPVSDAELKRIGLSESDFLSDKYDTDSLKQRLYKKVNQNVSAEAYKVFELVMNDYIEQFELEFAAISHHDNCKGGLLAHTTKVVQACGLLKMYPNIVSRVGMDILYVGAAFHDIGKIVEYNSGIISEKGKMLSHSILGIEILGKYRDQIIELKGADFYNLLVAVIAQHHGEFGERPRTLAAYLVHIFDYLESTLTGLDEAAETCTDSVMVVNGYKLS